MKRNQNERVLEYLKVHGSITPLEALNELGVMRLGARIWELRNEGHAITRVLETGMNRNGETVRYARYALG